MSSSDFSEEQRHYVQSNIERNISCYVEEIQNKIRILKEQIFNDELELKLSKVEDEIAKFDERCCQRKILFKERIQDASILAWAKFLEGKCVDEYDELFPDFLKEVATIYQRAKESLDNSDFDRQYESELHSKKREIMKQLDLKKAIPLYKQLSTLQKLHPQFHLNLESIEDTHIDDFCEFMKINDLETYTICQRFYEYYQNLDVKDDFSSCPNCRKRLHVSKILSVKTLDHIEKINQYSYDLTYSCEPFCETSV